MKYFIASALLFSMLFLLSFSSCVSTEKYNDIRSANNRTRMENDSLKAVIDEKRLLEYDLLRLKGNVKSYTEQMENTEQKYRNLDRSYKDLLKRYDEILFQNQALLANTSEEKRKLVEELGQQQRQLDEKERDLNRLGYHLEKLETEPGPEPAPSVEPYSTNEIPIYDQQLGKLQSMLEDKDEKLRILRTRINQALHGFSSADLSVSEANGKIYVSLSQNLLFPPNSTVVDWKGKTALKKLTEVLQKNPDIEINVEGHTDPDGSEQQNWDLSVKRATAVVNVLTGYGVAPQRITASGRSYFFPLAPNSTEEGKARNRRTEIILSPKLDELYQIINQ